MLMMMAIQWYNMFTQNIRLQNLSVHFRFLSSSSGNDANNWRPHGKPCMANACDWLKNDAAVTMSTEKYCFLSPAWNWLDGFTHNASTQRRPGIYLFLHTAHFYARKTWSRTDNFCTNTFTKQRSTHGCFYTQRLWQTRTSLTHTQMPLHTNVLIRRSFCAQELTQSKPWHTQMLLHRKLLHT